MKNVIIGRLSQLLIAFICSLRELMNAIIDIEQYDRLVDMISTVTKFPTSENASLIFSRSTHSPLLTHFTVITLILAHAVVGLIILVGTITLLKSVKSSRCEYCAKKTCLILGLSLGCAEYVFFFGFMAMDVFLSWMNEINFNTSILAYGGILMLSLLYLVVTDFGFLANKDRQAA